jgi:integrase
LGWCAERKLIDQNPLASRKFRRPRQKPLGGPTLDQINQVLKHSAEIRVPLLAVLALTGMRASECCYLKPEDVDLKGGWIHVISRPGFENKTGQSWKVPIHPRLRQILQDVPKNQREWFFTALPSPRYPSGGHHLNMKRVCEDFKKFSSSLAFPSARRMAVSRSIPHGRPSRSSASTLASLGRSSTRGRIMLGGGRLPATRITA